MKTSREGTELVSKEEGCDSVGWIQPGSSEGFLRNNELSGLWRSENPHYNKGPCIVLHFVRWQARRRHFYGNDIAPKCAPYCMYVQTTEILVCQNGNISCDFLLGGASFQLRSYITYIPVFLELYLCQKRDVIIRFQISFNFFRTLYYFRLSPNNDSSLSLAQRLYIGSEAFTAAKGSETLWDIGCVNWLQILMMGEMVPETLVIFKQLAWLITQKDFIDS